MAHTYNRAFTHTYTVGSQPAMDANAEHGSQTYVCNCACARCLVGDCCQRVASWGTWDQKCPHGVSIYQSCPACGRWITIGDPQTVRWDTIRWSTGANTVESEPEPEPLRDADGRPLPGYWRCPACGAIVSPEAHEHLCFGPETSISSRVHAREEWDANAKRWARKPKDEPPA